MQVATTLLTLHLDHFDSLLVLNARTVSGVICSVQAPLQDGIGFLLRDADPAARDPPLRWCGCWIAQAQESLVRGCDSGARPCILYFLACPLCRSPVVRLLSAVIITPLILAHPIAATTLLSSWDAKQGPDGWLQYSCTLTVVFAIISTSLLSSYAGEAAHRASQALLTQLDAQAARSQGLLETAMPSYVARALLSRVPDAELTVSCESATVAFIALSRFDELSARMHPRELMQVRE